MTDILATEATLAELKDRIGDEVAPDAGTVNKHLADILIDSLLNLKTADLQITASKELVVLNTALVGAVETPNVAFTGGIPKTAPGLGDLTLAYRRGVLASNATWTSVLSLSVPGVVESVECATDYNSTDFDIKVDGFTLGIIAPDGSISDYLIPLWLNNFGGDSTFWKESKYDAPNNEYSLFLKNRLQYNSSLAVLCRQESGVNKNVAVFVNYRGIS